MSTPTGLAGAGDSVDFTVLIPARLASTRLPNKPLADIAGKPMIVRVAERAALAFDAGGSGTVSPVSRQVVVAADSQEIVSACSAHGVQAVLTRTDHPSGSDRLAEACDILGLPDSAIVVNVQGDEPLMDPQLVRDVATLLQQRPLASMSTAAHVIHSQADFLNPNVVKVVLDAQGMALYFSRASIPFARDVPGGPTDVPWWLGDAAAPDDPLSRLRRQAAPLRHIGIYGYRVGFLKGFPKLPQAPLEVVEALEQMRAMWHGHRIAVHVAPFAPGPGVDTPSDLEKVRMIFLRP